MTGGAEHEPRPVSLTGQERRTLRALEEALAADDPALAELLAEGAPRRARRISRATLVITVAIAVLGLLLADAVLQTGGALLLLLVLPMLWWSVAVWTRRW